MYNIIQLGLLLFILFLPVSFILFYYMKGVYGNFSPLTYWISNLGEEGAKSQKYFNVTVFTLGFLGIPTIYNLSRVLQPTTLSTIGIILLYILAITLMLIVFFPLGKRTMAHLNLSGVLFSSLLFSQIALFYPVYQSAAISLWASYLSLLVIGISLTLLMSAVLVQLKYKVIPDNLVKIRPCEKSFLIRNITLWEWFTLVLSGVWFFVMSVSVYLALY